MNSLNEIKKIYKKSRKLQHVVIKETGIKCSETPTNIIVICNSGLVNGLSEEVIVQNFKQFGVIESIALLPGKSCAFISYTKVLSAEKAMKSNGKIYIAQDNKPVYLSYAECLPNIDEEKKCVFPPGLIILENFITEGEEKLLSSLCDFKFDEEGQMKHRHVKHYGYEFRYDINNVDKDKPLQDKVPVTCDFLWERLNRKNTPIKNFLPDQLTINYYSSGKGIPPHVDTHSAFEDPIISLSLLSSVVMDFKKGITDHCSILLPQRSLAIMSGECRYNWSHGITPRRFDVVKTQNGYSTLLRKTRISFTFRRIRHQECDCKYQEICDSYKCRSTQQVIQNNVANELERIHVHDVYEKIASHFSDTRHKPWPNVLDFVNSLDVGSILIDVGCGNGKYLGKKQLKYEVGCDTSSKLLEVCKTRGHETFACNCLNLPIKDGIADAVISIAVIHHLATEERRVSAIKEIIRILREGGKALIYVWAKDQLKDKEKSNYIRQDRKHESAQIVPNHVLNEEINVVGVKLAVHKNRTQFKHKDMLVPWKLKPSSGSGEHTDEYLRFYHVYEEFELENACRKLSDVSIIKSYYDEGNWCTLIEKVDVVDNTMLKAAEINN